MCGLRTEQLKFCLNEVECLGLEEEQHANMPDMSVLTKILPKLEEVVNILKLSGERRHKEKEPQEELRNGTEVREKIDTEQNFGEKPDDHMTELMF